MTFERTLPKCTSCGRTSKKWVASHPAVCPYCGGAISYEREALAQTGVHNPKDKSIAPKGVGETFAERRTKGIFGFYDSQAQGYRECHLDKILKIAFDGNEYIVVK